MNFQASLVRKQLLIKQQMAVALYELVASCTESSKVVQLPVTESDCISFSRVPVVQLVLSCM